MQRPTTPRHRHSLWHYTICAIMWGRESRNCGKQTLQAFSPDTEADDRNSKYASYGIEAPPVDWNCFSWSHFSMHLTHWLPLDYDSACLALKCNCGTHSNIFFSHLMQIVSFLSFESDSEHLILLVVRHITFFFGHKSCSIYKQTHPDNINICI